jgi:hypothetical protein
MALLLVAAFADAATRRPSRRVVRARVVAVDAAAQTITVRGSGAADETFTLDPAAARRLGRLEPGDRVVLTVRRAVKGRPGVVMRVVRVAPSSAPATVVVTPGSSRPPTDTVGPLRDPRSSPGADPRKDPLRDPRVVPGLSEPAPTPTPTPTPSPR